MYEVITLALIYILLALAGYSERSIDQSLDRFHELHEKSDWEIVPFNFTVDWYKSFDPINHSVCKEGARLEQYALTSDCNAAADVTLPESINQLGGAK